MNTYTVRHARGKQRLVDVIGLPSPAVGLAFTQGTDLNANPTSDFYGLTHIRSGLSLTHNESVEQLAAIAIELADIDWTRSADDLRGDPDVKARTLAAIRRFYAGHINGATASHDGTADLC